MVSLLDLAPLSLTVEVRGQPIEVTGLNTVAIAGLLAKFPELQKAIGGKVADLTTESLMRLAPNAVAHIIAHGVGDATDPMVAAVMNLTAGEQLELLAAIIKLTMPGGLVPFMAKLTGLTGAVPAPALGDGLKVRDSN
jgi:hypothetical protein